MCYNRRRFDSIVHQRQSIHWDSTTSVHMDWTVRDDNGKTKRNQLITMGLDDFGSDSESSGSSIKTRKQIENVQLDEVFWDNVVTTNPGVMYAAAISTDEPSAKAIVQKIDEALDGDIEGHDIGEEITEGLEEVREEIIQDMNL